MLQHMPDTQAVLWQSPSSTHPFVVMHFVLQLPPQSMSVSSPSFIPSAHAVHLPAVHSPDAQSPATLHVLSSAHFWFVGAVAQLPPQSMSVSSPSVLPSLQLTQVPVESHLPLAQSPGFLQCWPSLQAGQVAPPQSVSVSSPLVCVSVQLAQAFMKQ
jgi:hypothetical protein